MSSFAYCLKKCIIKQLLNSVFAWYHELSKPSVCIIYNTDLGFDNSWYHAQPHPIIVYCITLLRKRIILLCYEKHFYSLISRCTSWEQKGHWLVSDAFNALVFLKCSPILLKVSVRQNIDVKCALRTLLRTSSEN